MKRSEYLRQRTDLWQDRGWAANAGPVVPPAGLRAEADAEAAEAAGVVWDPEELELPERLEMRGKIACRPDGSMVATAIVVPGMADQPDRYRSDRNEHDLLEAVRRYNLWPYLRRIQERIAHLPVDDSRHAIARDLLALLDGRP
jgi:hypothetical protein